MSLSNTAKKDFTKANASANLLERAAWAIWRTISADTLEPGNLKWYEFGRDLPLSGALDLQEVLRSMRFRVGEAIHAFHILLSPTIPIVAVPHAASILPPTQRFPQKKASK